MKTGPPPKPTSLRALNGFAGKRGRGKNEPKPDPSPEDPPTWLRGDALALEIWTEFAPKMIRLGLLTTVDRIGFAAMCERTSLYWRAARELRPRVESYQDGKGRRRRRRVNGLTQESGPNGRVKKPEAEIAKGALDSLRQLCAVFGMSPADRTRLEIPPIPPGGEGSGKSKPTGLKAFLEKRRARHAASTS